MWSWKPKTLSALSLVLCTLFRKAPVLLGQRLYLASEVMFLFLQGLPHAGEHLKPRSAKSHTPHAPGTPLLGTCSQKRKKATCTKGPFQCDLHPSEGPAPPMTWVWPRSLSSQAATAMCGHRALSVQPV